MTVNPSCKIVPDEERPRSTAHLKPTLQVQMEMFGTVKSLLLWNVSYAKRDRRKHFFDFSRTKIIRYRRFVQTRKRFPMRSWDLPFQVENITQERIYIQLFVDLVKVCFPCILHSSLSPISDRSIKISCCYLRTYNNANVYLLLYSLILFVY